MDVRKQALRQLAQLRQAEGLGAKLARRYVRAFERKAIAAARSRGKVTVTAADRKQINDELVDLMLEGFVRRYEFLRAGLGIELSFSSRVERLAKKLDLNIPGIRRTFTTLAGKRVTESIRFIEGKINKALVDTSIRQQPTKIAVKNMRRRLHDMGLASTRPSIVETLVRTHSQMAFNAAQYQLEQDDPEELITGYQYVTVGDDRVRDEHADMDGVIFKVGDPELDQWWPPNGWNCRCQLVTLTDTVSRSSRINPDLAPDEGFDFNPGKLLED